LFRRNFKT